MEKLYNNIIMPETREIVDAQSVPYLKNPPEVIDISVGRQLLVDDFLIEETDLTAEYHKAKKFEGNPILHPETPWETDGAPVACPKSGGVWFDEEDKKFKMWYEATWLKNMCYAESADGINWVRPKLDDDGTNIILKYDGFVLDKFKGGDPNYLRPDSTTVFIDYDCPKDEKYKLFLRNPGAELPGIVAVSADGINFRDFRLTGNMFDRSTIFYNPFRKKWVYSIRSIWNGIDAVPLIRTRDYRECDNYLDGAEWSKDECHKWMCSDELDAPNPYIGMKPQLYNVDCVGYESIMLGMFQILYGPENDVTEANGVPKITELMPMYSRDGYHFSRPCRDSIINASMYEGSWDRGYIQSVGGVLLIHGDELWIYYIGFAGDKKYKKLSWSVNGLYRNGATGIAKLRRDGFVSMNGNGTLTTRKMIFCGKESFFINAVGEVSAEILSAEGKLLAKSNTFSGDSTKAFLDFDGFDIKSLNNKVFRLKFNVSGKLYSFGFADKCGDAGGAHAAGRVNV